TAYVGLFIAHRAQVYGELPNAPVGAQNLQLEIIHWLAGKNSGIRVAKRVVAHIRNQRLDRLSENRLLLISHNLPAAIGITYATAGVRHKNEALRVVQDLAGEVALSLQFRLVCL